MTDPNPFAPDHTGGAAGPPPYDQTPLPGTTASNTPATPVGLTGDATAAPDTAPDTAPDLGQDAPQHAAPSPTGQPDYGQPAADQPAYDQPYDQPAAGQPTAAQSAYGQSATEQPATEQTPADQTSYGQSTASQPAYGQPYGQPAASQSPTGHPATGQSATGQTPADSTSYTQPTASGAAYGQSATGQSGYGQTPADQASYGQPTASQPAYGQSPTGQSSTGQPATGQSPYDQSPTGQTPADSTSYTQPTASGAAYGQSATGQSGYGQSTYDQYADGQQAYAPSMAYAAPTGTAGGMHPLNKPYYGCSFPEAFVRFWQNYVSFSGRASRSEFWWWALAAFGIQLALELFTALFTSLSFLTTIWNLAVLLPTLALSVRRLHDSNLPGWWLAVYYGSSIAAAILLFIGNGLTLLSAFGSPYHAYASQFVGGFGMLIVSLMFLVTFIVVYIYLMTRAPRPEGVRFDDDYGAAVPPSPYLGMPYPGQNAPYTGQAYLDQPPQG